jgi:hypothetical protein
VRWFRQNIDLLALARDHGISRATGYRYLDEVMTVLAEQAPDLHDALRRANNEGAASLILDGTTSVKASRSTCGTPGKPASTAGTSTPCRHQTASRCGWVTSRPARSMT